MSCSGYFDTLLERTHADQAKQESFKNQVLQEILECAHELKSKWIKSLQVQGDFHKANQVQAKLEKLEKITARMKKLLET